MKAGQTIADRYRLEVRLGIGGMGEVWKATHAGTGREFAVKFMHAHAATSPPARARFLRESRVSAKINHPNVIDIFDAGELDDGALYLVMELLDGISLGDAFHAAPPLEVQELLSVMLDTARALAAAHAVGVVHRDIKPANIFLHKDRATGLAAAKILDFGISKFGGNDDSHATATGAVLGSPRYMSPEQTRSAASVDHRADLWAMGVILFEGLMGTWPHEGDSFSSLVVAICTTPPTSIDLMVPDLPEPLRAVVRDCLKPVRERLASAGELAERLALVVQDPALAALPLPRPLHPPSESVKTTTGVRVRPPLLTTLTTTGSPESLRTTQERARTSQPTPAVPLDLPPPSAPFSLQSQTLPRPLLAPLAPPRPPPPPLPIPSPAAPAAGPLDRFRPHATTVPIYLADDAVQTAKVPVAPPPPAALHAGAVTMPIDPSAAPRSPFASSGGALDVAGFAANSPLPAVQATPVPAAPPSGDPLVGTVSRMNLTTTTSCEPAAAPLAAAPPPAPAPAPTMLTGDKGLRFMAAALAVLLVGIILALISVIGTSPGNVSPAAPASGSEAAPSPPPPPVPTVSVTAPAAPERPADPPAVSASASASAAGQAAPASPPGTSKAPAGRGTAQPPRGGVKPKLQQLGSGL
jgi:eukaryotic-like serine/threonine-protein kinase